MITILGTGAIGIFHASQFRKAGLPVTLIGRLTAMKRQANIQVQELNGTISRSECILDTVDYQSTHISTLLVCTKSFQVADALKPLLPRLDQHSIIALVCNGGLQVYDEVSRLFPKNKPRILVGLTTHGVVKGENYSAVHTGLGQTVIGLADANDHQDLETALAAEITVLDHDSIMIEMSIKLAINACLNPLTALLNCRNGVLLNDKQLLREVCDEVVSCFPEYPSEVWNNELVFGSVLKVATLTARNLNSMSVDICAGRKTEIDYISGYLLRKAKSIGIELPLNEMLFRLIKLAETSKTEGIPPQ